MKYEYKCKVVQLPNELTFIYDASEELLNFMECDGICLDDYTNVDFQGVGIYDADVTLFFDKGCYPDYEDDAWLKVGNLVKIHE